MGQLSDGSNVMYTPYPRLNKNFSKTPSCQKNKKTCIRHPHRALQNELQNDSIFMHAHDHLKCISLIFFFGYKFRMLMNLD